MADRAESTEDGQHPLDRAMLEQWPEMPDDQIAIWSGLSTARKQKAVDRLTALKGLKGEGDAPPRHLRMADAAAAAKTSPSTFYTIAKRWRAAPSVEALGVHVTNEGPGLTAASEARSRMLGQVRLMLGEEPDLGNAEIRRRLGETFGKAPAFATVKRLVQDSQRDMPPTMPFGSSIVMDSAGLDVFYDQGIPTRLYAVLDLGTALVLGWEIWSHDDPAGGYARAAHHALNGTRAPRGKADDPMTGMASLDLTGVRATAPPSLELRVLPGDAAKLSTVQSDEEGFHVVEDASLGRSVVEALGERLASTWIGTGSRKAGRSYRTGRVEEMPILTSRLRQRISDALHDHDLYRLGLMPRDAGDGPPEEALAALRGLLLPIARDADIGGLAPR